MDAEFWHERWRGNELGFHEGRPNAFLVRHFERLALAPASRVFVPLCGKTRDIGWLLSRGARVCGAELSAIAVEQLFRDLGVTPRSHARGELVQHSGDGIDIFVGDLFSLSAAVLGPVDAVYDRAALVALPGPTRRRYAAHLKAITGSAPQLLITFEYDQALMPGPPFSVEPDEIAALYGEAYEIETLASRDVPGGLKGTCPATESARLLRGK